MKITVEQKYAKRLQKRRHVKWRREIIEERVKDQKPFTRFVTIKQAKYSDDFMVEIVRGEEDCN